MSFFGDNIFGNLFNNSTKTHEDLDRFINKKFSYYLNNSNLLLNFVSDFEDYKNNERNDNKSKCDECESLYILTSQIFEKYINKVKVPFDINIYSEGKENSGINYNNKVLYFFDLKDLNKILQSNNLAKSSENDNVLIKKRILCKIISLSFIKIYIIIKSIFQTFNIYNSLIKNKSATDNSDLDSEALIEPANRPDAAPVENIDAAPMETADAAPVETVDAVPMETTNAPQVDRPDAIMQDTVQETREENKPEIKQEPISGMQPNVPVGGGLFDLFNPFPKEIKDMQIEPQRAIKLQTSKNVFYSIFVILFENTEYELTSKNFTANFIINNLNTISDQQFLNKFPDIFKYICETKLYNSDFISKNSIIFNNNNFTFLKLKTSDALESKTDASSYLKDIDEKYQKKTIDNSKKLKKSKECFTKENIEFIINYCNKNLDLSTISILNSVKNILRTMINNYFKNRNKLYDTIIVKLIKFNSKNKEIENIIQSLTYANIVDLTEQTKNIILDLHIDIFKSLNSIVDLIRSRLIHKYGNQLNVGNSNIEQSNQASSTGGKSRKKYRKNKKYTRKQKYKYK